MARESKQIKPLFPMDDHKEEKIKKDHQPKEVDDRDSFTEENKQEDKKETQHNNTTSLYSKYKKTPKYKTHVPHNVRIPKGLRQEMERIARKLGVPLGKNSGFFQEFTIDALEAHVVRVKKELGMK
jgi:hypothetical protein